MNSPTNKPNSLITCFLLGAFIYISGTAASHAQTARYSVKFTGTWSPSDISSSYPSSAHFSELIGATHQAGAEFWKNGGLASPGVELVAELGSNFELQSELAAAKQAGTTGDIIEFQSLFNLPNSDTVEIDVADDKPFITLITMIAPSPDWFVGVSGLSLQDNGEWIRTLSVELRPYDAGTEEGNTFSLSNPPSPDSARITRLTGNDSPFIGRPSIGRLEFTLLNRPPVTPPQPPAPPISPPSTENNAALTALLGLLLSD